MKRRNFRTGSPNKTPAEREAMADLFYLHVYKEKRRYSDFQAATGLNPILCRRYFLEFYAETITYKKKAKA